jgi:hypothetical protein
MLDIVDSSGSDVLTSMSAQQDKPEDANIAGTREDVQQLACSSVERLLPFVTASEVSDGQTFIMGASAMPLNWAAFGVHDDRIAKKHDVLVLLKLLELSLSANKELYVKPMIPQFIDDMVAWGTSLNHLHAKGSGMLMSTHASIFVVNVGPPSAEVCRTAASFP